MRSLVDGSLGAIVAGMRKREAGGAEGKETHQRGAENCRSTYPQGQRARDENGFASNVFV